MVLHTPTCYRDPMPPAVRRRSPATLAALAATTAGLVGCASGPSVTLRVESPTGTPVPGAFVHLAPIAMSEVPLPVSLTTLSESGAPGASGVTDDRGEITLSLSIDRPHDVAVTPPFTRNDPDRRATWRGRLDPTPDRASAPSIRPIHPAGPGAPAPDLIVTVPERSK